MNADGFSHAGESTGNVTAAAGQEVRLLCPGNTTGQSIRWWKTQKSGDIDRIVFLGDVQPAFEDRMLFDNTTGELIIPVADVIDSGVFWCDVGFLEFEIHLTVLGKLQQQNKSWLI